MFTYKLRAYPTKRQERDLDAMLKDLRRVYNWALNERKQHHLEHGEGLSRKDQSKLLTQLRASDPRLQRWSAGAAQETLKQVHLSFSAFFRRVANSETPGYPRFKGKRGLKSATFVTGKGGASYYASHNVGRKGPKRRTNHKNKTATVKIQSVGHVKVRQHRKIKGNVKTLTIKRERYKWYLLIVTDHEPDPLPKTGKVIGADVGKETFLATSEGDIIANPRFLKTELAKLTRQQRSQAAAPGGTKAKRQAGERMDATTIKRSRRVGNTHERIRNKRADFHNKLAHSLVTAADTIYIEDLDIAGIIEGDPQFNIYSKTAENRNTYDAGWGMFITKLLAKAASAGREVVLVDPSYTSQRCNKCSHIDRGNRTYNKFRCLKCGHADHADVNAAKNIKTRGQGVVFRSWQPSDASNVNSRSAQSGS